MSDDLHQWMRTDSIPLLATSRLAAAKSAGRRAFVFFIGLWACDA